MKVQPLSFGVIIGKEDYKVILRDNGYFQFIEDALLSQVELEDFVFFLPKKDGKSNIVVPLSEFDYFENIRNVEHDPALYKDNCGLCVPKMIMLESSKFIVNNGFGCQYIVYYQQDGATFAGWNYSNTEQTIINAYFSKKIYPKDAFDINQKLIEIDQYLNEINVEEIIDSFVIENEEIFHCRPGKDDWYYVNKVYKDVEEPYINRLFPHHSECIYHDSGFCPARSMSINPPKRYYINEEDELKKNARNKYDKDEHRRFLVERMVSDYKFDLMERCDNMNYKNLIFSRAINQIFHLDRMGTCKYEDGLRHFCSMFNSILDASKR